MAIPPADDYPADPYRTPNGPDSPDRPAGTLPPASGGAAAPAPAGAEPLRTAEPGAMSAAPSGQRSRPADSTVSRSPHIKRTRVSGTWIAVIVAAVVLIFLLVFILQNLDTVTVQFLGLSGSLPLGVAMLFSAIAGAILVALVGTARILQLRRFAKRVGSR